MNDIGDRSDFHKTKRNCSAFAGTHLLETLQTLRVTSICLCGCNAHVGVYSTAFDAVRHALDVTIITDCLEYRSEAKHEEAIRAMEEHTNVGSVDSYYRCRT